MATPSAGPERDSTSRDRCTVQLLACLRAPVSGARVTASHVRGPATAGDADGGAIVMALGARIITWRADSDRPGRPPAYRVSGALDIPPDDSGSVHDVTCVAYTPDGSAIAAGDASGRIAVVAGDGSAVRRFLRGHTGEINRLCFGRARKGAGAPEEELKSRTAAASAKGTWLYSASADGAVRVWDCAAGALVGLYISHDAEILGLAVGAAAGGAYERVATSSADGVVSLWDGWLQRRLASLLPSPAWRSVPVATPPVSVAKTWNDSEADEDACAGQGHSGSVTSVALSQTCEFMLTTSRDHSARLWNVKSLRRDLESVAAERDAAARVAESAAAVAHAAHIADDLQRDGDTAFGELDETAKRELAAALRDSSSGGAGTATGSSIPGGQKPGTPQPIGYSATAMFTFAHSAAVVDCAFSVDGRIALTVGLDCAVKIWEVATGRQIFQINTPEPVDARSIVLLPSDELRAKQHSKFSAAMAGSGIPAPLVGPAAEHDGSPVAGLRDPASSDKCSSWRLFCVSGSRMLAFQVLLPADDDSGRMRIPRRGGTAGSASGGAAASYAAADYLVPLPGLDSAATRGRVAVDERGAPVAATVMIGQRALPFLQSLVRQCPKVTASQLFTNMERFDASPSEVVAALAATPFAPSDILEALSKAPVHRGGDALPQGDVSRGRVPVEVLFARIKSRQPIGAILAGAGYAMIGSWSANGAPTPPHVPCWPVASRANVKSGAPPGDKGSTKTLPKAASVRVRAVDLGSTGASDVFGYSVRADALREEHRKPKHSNEVAHFSPAQQLKLMRTVRRYGIDALPTVMRERLLAGGGLPFPNFELETIFDPDGRSFVAQWDARDDKLDGAAEGSAVLVEGWDRHGGRAERVEFGKHKPRAVPPNVDDAVRRSSSVASELSRRGRQVAVGMAGSAVVGLPSRLAVVPYKEDTLRSAEAALPVGVRGRVTTTRLSPRRAAIRAGRPEPRVLKGRAMPPSRVVSVPTGRKGARASAARSSGSPGGASVLVIPTRPARSVRAHSTVRKSHAQTDALATPQR